MKHIIAIMAGGLGKRMNSDLPKVLHSLNNKPMICRLIETSYEVKPSVIMIIVGKYMQIIKDTIEKYIPQHILQIIKYINQPDALGTGHAIKCCLPFLSSNANYDDRILILSGDTPLVSAETMSSMLNSKESMAMITKYDNDDVQSYNKFKDYGKIIDGENNKTIKKIVEKKDCNVEQIKINLVNCGIYCYSFDVLLKCVPQIKNTNAQNEYYLTDLIEIANNHNYLTYKFELENHLQYEIIGVNTSEQLKELEILIKTIKN